MNSHSESMPLIRLEDLRRVLLVVLDQVDPGALGIKYRLAGTAAALAQGVQLPAGDVDILVARRADVDRFAIALSPFTSLAPVWLADSHQYFARFKIEAVRMWCPRFAWSCGWCQSWYEAARTGMCR